MEQQNHGNRIGKTILVMSGKGGVGKSSVAVNLAVWMAIQNRKTGLLDIDLHGPSIPKMLGMEEQKIFQIEGQMHPAQYRPNLKVMSIGFLLENPDTPIIWRGPAKHSFLQQCIQNVWWDQLDVLVVDCPPGTGDEVLSVVHLLGKIDGAILVTTPQEIALLDVRKCISFCQQLKIPVLGLIENMNGLLCPHCGKKVDLFGYGACQDAAEQFGVPVLGGIPFAPELARTGDIGRPIVQNNPLHPAAQALAACFQSALGNDMPDANESERSMSMKIAVPLHEGRLSAHFGHCSQFAVVEVDPQRKTILHIQLHTPPAHEPGVLPQWLSHLQVGTVIAGGMGQRAQSLFQEKNIRVLVGAPCGTPEELVQSYLDGSLKLGQNVCEH
ncbi:MAG TPA: iron-sulfur cluster carrier protein MrpORP [Anaerohalosphaeraceae bacterium]|nr:iron-sulfur cluster carrier protein MrpORP [Anaerohalosphaeraceae bacterium]